MSWWESAGLGLSAALMPGALQAFFFAQAVQRGWKGAWPLAFTPVLSDGPVVAFTLWALGRLPEAWLASLRWVGAAFLLWVAWRLWRAAPEVAAGGTDPGVQRSLFQAVSINWLNPNVYIFWATVLGPPVLAAWRRDPWAGAGLVAAFYAAIVAGSAGLLAVFSRAHGLSARWRVRLTRLSAALMGLFALLLARPG